jgi:hypothetical protein
LEEEGKKIIDHFVNNAKSVQEIDDGMAAYKIVLTTCQQSIDTLICEIKDRMLNPPTKEDGEIYLTCEEEFNHLLEQHCKNLRFSIHYDQRLATENGGSDSEMTSASDRPLSSEMTNQDSETTVGSGKSTYRDVLAISGTESESEDS